MVEGLGTVGNRKYKANVFARYTFPSGRMKGLYLGGGYRYLGRMLVGTWPTGELRYAPPVGEGNFLAGREFRLKGERTLRVQLNVSNLFDEDDAIIGRYNATGDLTRPRQINIRAPRTWRLTTDLTF